MGRTRMGMRSLTIVQFIRKSEDCPKAPSSINRPFDGHLRHDGTGKERGSHPPRSKPGGPILGSIPLVRVAPHGPTHAGPGHPQCLRRFVLASCRAIAGERSELSIAPTWNGCRESATPLASSTRASGMPAEMYAGARPTGSLWASPTVEKAALRRRKNQASLNARQISGSQRSSLEMSRDLRISPTRNRSVSRARRWIEALRLSTNCEPMEG
jgi:hypothetical protein